jgi:hypothetical protein
VTAVLPSVYIVVPEDRDQARVSTTSSLAVDRVRAQIEARVSTQSSPHWAIARPFAQIIAINMAAADVTLNRVFMSVSFVWNGYRSTRPLCMRAVEAAFCDQFVPLYWQSEQPSSNDDSPQKELSQSDEPQSLLHSLFESQYPQSWPPREQCKCASGPAPCRNPPGTQYRWL